MAVYTDQVLESFDSNAFVLAVKTACSSSISFSHADSTIFMRQKHMSY